MNTQTVILLCVIALCAVGALIHWLRSGKKCGGCCGDCSACDRK